MTQKLRRDIYQEVTDRILDILDRGVVPWRNAIRSKNGGDGWPKNMKSGKRYRGINVFLLACMSWDKGYQSDFWLTFKQAKELGGTIRKGEKSSLVTFFKMYEKQDKETGEEYTLPCLKHYNLFSIEQCDGIEAPDTIEFEPLEFTPIKRAEQILSGYTNPPVIKQQGSKACYRMACDTIEIAPPEQFDSVENYYSVLFHEIGHSTGANKRLGRGFEDDPQPYGSPDYSREELIAECTAAFLSATAGILEPTIEQSASYIEHWKKALRGDKRLVVSAAAAAQKSADHVLGTTYEATP